MVRQESAKLLYGGSIPPYASRKSLSFFWARKYSVKTLYGRNRKTEADEPSRGRANFQQKIMRDRFPPFVQVCPGGVIGSHARLKILWPYGRAGSIPAPGTKKDCKVFFEPRGGNRKTEADEPSRGRANFQQKIMRDRFPLKIFLTTPFPSA